MRGTGGVTGNGTAVRVSPARLRVPWLLFPKKDRRYTQSRAGQVAFAALSLLAAPAVSQAPIWSRVAVLAEATCPRGQGGRRTIFEPGRVPTSSATGT